MSLVSVIVLLIVVSKIPSPLVVVRYLFIQQLLLLVQLQPSNKTSLETKALRRRGNRDKRRVGGGGGDG